MAVFEIEIGGKTYEVDAPDQASAMAAIQGAGQRQPQPKPADPRDSVLGKVDSFVRGAADTLTFGLADEIAASLNSGSLGGLNRGLWGDYEKALAAERGIDAADAKDRQVYRVVGQLAGGVGGGAGLVKNGLSATANAVNAGKNLAKVSAASALEGGLLGAAQGFGSGEGADRVGSTFKGGLTGGVFGLATPGAIAGASAVAKPVIAPVMARLRPDEYAATAIGEGLQRSGSSIDDIARALASARADGQGVFTVADAMGNAGQRMLSTAARNPHEARQELVEALLGRQMDQGRRVAGALQDASGTILTANQFTDMARQARSAQAATNYAPVATDTTAINVTPAVAAANRSISPLADISATAQGAVPTDLAARRAVEAAESTIRDPIREAVRTARSYLASDTLTVTNVEKAFRAKTNIDQMISSAIEKNRGAEARALEPVRDALDAALARTSPQYARARDAYAAASRPIEAVEAGRNMASPRSRSQDVISSFGAMDTTSQNAARIGYFDPMIARAEAAAGTMTDSARPFLSNSMRLELPVLAAEGQAPLLGRRLARETTMSETAKAALGGSKTADNLADAAELAKFDPGIMTSLMRGRPIEVIAAALSRGSNEAKGLPPRVIERVARVMIETDPDAARKALEIATTKTDRDKGVRAIANAILTNMSGSTAGRLAAP